MINNKKLSLFALAFLLTLSANSYADNFYYVLLTTLYDDYDSHYFSNPDFSGMSVSAGTYSGSSNVYVKFGAAQSQLTFVPKWSEQLAPWNIYSRNFGIGLDHPWWGTDAFFYIDENKNGAFDSGEPNRTILASTRPAGTYFFLAAPVITSITGGFHPTFSWDPIEGADQYRFGIAGINPDGTANIGDLKFITPWSTETSYSYTGDLFQSYQPYAIFIEARDNLPSSGAAVNRSRFITQYAVSDPLTIFSLATGLIAIVGFKRRKFFSPLRPKFF
jgi:hypothetical protein